MIDRFLPPSASPARRHRLRPRRSHVVPRVGCVDPTAQRLPVKAKPYRAALRCVPLPSTPLRAGLDVAPRSGGDGDASPAGLTAPPGRPGLGIPRSISARSVPWDTTATRW